MKIKRFFAKDMRAALAQVKETLGSDAVIMSNKKVAGGIEIVAAVDYDEPKSVAKTPVPGFMDLSEDRVSLASKSGIKAQTKVNPPPAADSLQALLEKQQQRLSQPARPKTENEDLPEWARQLQGATDEVKKPAKNAYAQPQLDRSSKQAKSSNAEIELLREEMASLRNLLTHQVTTLMQDQRKRKDPVGAMLESKLLGAEFSAPVAAKLAGLSQHYSPVELVRSLPQSLANLLDNQGDDIVKRGGVVAFVGPTGVGKTTSLAKIAARFAAKHGADQVALITTDHYRIGAFEQLATYGKIMGCPVKQAHDLAELEQILYQFRNRKLVLIDTAGMGQRDMRLTQQLDNLTANSRIPIRSYLVMSATGHRKVLQDAVNHFKRIPLSGAILTKLDESVSIAGALSVLIQNGLPLSYVTDGQRVPEDINVADTLALAKQALMALNEPQQPMSQETVAWSNDMAYAFE